MPTSSRLRAGMLLAALIGTVGCARVAARPPESNPAAGASTPAAGASTPAAGASTPAAGASTPAPSTQSLDPSEEITAQELASIPEPVPAGQTGRRSPEAPEGPSASGVVQNSPTAPEAAQSPSKGPAAGDNGDSGQVVWRVQIFASQDLQLADRKGKEAAERLQVRAHLEFEAPYYKVRLGDFATEEEAQALREQAIRAGYPGAFRTRCSPDITQDGQ